MAMQAIRCDDSSIVVAGGQESMSNAPHCIRMRTPINFGNKPLEDSLVTDGLTDCFHNCSMGITAENVAKKHNISRLEQDVFAVDSQNKTKIAMETNAFNAEIMPITVKTRKDSLLIKTDEHPRPSTTIEGMLCCIYFCQFL